jgi:hypothetical protein
VKGLVPEVVEQKLREKLDPAYKLRDARMIEVLDRKEFDRQERKKRKKKA